MGRVVRSVLAWFAHNSVAANLVMVFIIVSGIVATTHVEEEEFPEIEFGLIQVEVPYLGAAPEEVEEAVNVRIEEAIQGIDGIREIVSTATEGTGTVMAQLELGADAGRVADEVKSHVDAIKAFPIGTEKPIIRELTNRQQVVEVAVSGDVDPRTLKQVAERVRAELTAIPEVTQVDIVSAPPYEISIEVSEDDLRRHGLTLEHVADAVRRSSLDLPGGAIRTERGEILLRTIGQAYRGVDFENLPLWTRADGSRLELGDVATVVDGFEETDQHARFDLEPALIVSVFRTGDRSAIEVARLVRAYVERAQVSLPAGVSLTVWRDSAEVLGSRLSMMLRHGLAGFAVVWVILALFLDVRLAFWVSLGIPISFLGAVALMPSLDVSVNVLSLFAFVLVLGVVVDDAVIVGENIYRHQEQYGDRMRGSFQGAHEVAKPVTFAVLTTVAAFSPLLFAPGMMGRVVRVVPLVVIPCLLFSLLESLTILPAHLSRHPKRVRRGPWRRFRAQLARGLEQGAQDVYRPVLERALRWRYLTASVGVAMMIVTLGMVASGRPTFQFFPTIEADFLSASVTMPQGTPADATGEAVARLEAGAARLRRRLLGETGQDYFPHVSAAIGDQPMAMRGGVRMGPVSGIPSSNVGEVVVELLPTEQRVYSSEQLGLLWRQATGPIPEAVGVDFEMSVLNLGSDIDVQLAGPDLDRLRAVAEELKQRLREYAGVYDVSDTLRTGKEEVKLGIKPAAEILGLTLQDLGRQVRQAFYGEEAQRFQRGRDDVRVMVRYPRDERRSLGDLENMRIRTADGGAVPFNQVAEVEPGRGFASIRRVDRNRAVNVTASVDPSVTSAGDVIADLDARILPEVLARYPGVFHTLEGLMAEQRDGVIALQRGFVLALLLIYLLLAVPLKSYVQPLIIMSAIPFGLIGAVWGHIFLGLNVSTMSLFGLVALTGVVVNDSLIMIDFINRGRREAALGLLARAAASGPMDREQLETAALRLAVRAAGVKRFRPILLTSLTTFFGLAPMVSDRSFATAFMVPMAVSLGFGVLFATVITLLLVPAAYLILDDLLRVAHRMLGGRSQPRLAV